MRTRKDILKEKRVEHGAEIVAALGRQLVSEFRRGFGEKNLRRMAQFGKVLPLGKIVATLSQELSWRHSTVNSMPQCAGCNA